MPYSFGYSEHQLNKGRYCSSPPNVVVAPLIF